MSPPTKVQPGTKVNSSTSPRWSRYFSRRCCLQMSAVCFCRFLVPNPILCTEFLYRILTAAHHRSEEHTSELQSHLNLVCRLLLEKKKIPLLHHSIILSL